MSLFHTNTLIGASGSGSDPIYAEDVFSTFLYDGAESAQTITNGIDLSGEGGLVWMKQRTPNANDHALMSSEVGDNDFGGWLSTNDDDAVTVPDTQYVTANSDGFRINNGGVFFNDGTEDYVSWTFRKCPGFFDVVTWTGNGSNRTISHSLGSTPGFIIIKRISDTEDWTCWHRSVGATKYLQLNGTGAEASLSSFMNDTEPTSTNFTVGTHDRVNTNGETYVAYVFAHDDQSFGTDSDEAIIKCGGYTGTGSDRSIDLGFEPQWIMMKVTSGDTGDWYIYDTMRGWTVIDNDNQNHLRANLNNAEYDSDTSGGLKAVPTNTGFRLPDSDHNKNTKEYIYIAIRRPHKPPTAGTEVFDPRTASSYALNSSIPCGFAPDLMIATSRTGSSVPNYVEARITDDWMDTENSNKEDTTNYFRWDSEGGKINLPTAQFGSDPIIWQFRRAPGFFDVVSYEGNGSGPRNITHNLGVIPELIITKNRTENSRDWRVWHKDLNGGGSNAVSYNLILNSNAAQSSNNDIFGGSSNVMPTSSVYTVGGNAGINESSSDQITYLFASLSGISKVGSYTGTGGAFNVDCGFTAGARFVLIKRIDSTGNWRVYDTARGIVAGNDPYLHLNSSDVEVTNNDGIDPYNQGFSITGSANADINADGGTYAFLAIA